MGCFPLGRVASKVLRRRRDGKYETRTWQPPPATTTVYYDQPLNKSVTFSANNHVVMMPAPESQKQYSPTCETVTSPAPAPQTHHQHHPEPEPSTQQATEQRKKPKKPKKSKQVRFSRDENNNNNANTPEHSQHPNDNNNDQFGQGSGSRFYVPSPMPVWEAGDCHHRRRREYFGGEFHYYPTPIREGIYSIATDANRITSMFSEENPNACSIS